MNPQSPEGAAMAETLTGSKKTLKLALERINRLDADMVERQERGTQDGTSEDTKDIWGNCASSVITYLEMAVSQDGGELGDDKLRFNAWAFNLRPLIESTKNPATKIQAEESIKTLIDKIKTTIEGVLAK